MSKLGKVLVAMSGGIDSTVTAMMMHEQGYEVIGITMKTWDYANSGGNKKETGCCSLDSHYRARGIPMFISNKQSLHMSSNYKKNAGPNTTKSTLRKGVRLLVCLWTGMCLSLANGAKQMGAPTEAKHG